MKFHLQCNDEKLCFCMGHCIGLQTIVLGFGGCDVA